MKDGGMIAVIVVLVLAVVGLGAYLVLGGKLQAETPPALGLANQLVNGGLGLANTAVGGGLEVADSAVDGALSPDFIPAIVEDLTGAAADIAEDLAAAASGAVEDITGALADIFTGGRA